MIYDGICELSLGSETFFRRLDEILRFHNFDIGAASYPDCMLAAMRNAK
jgi:hypothetical protein